MPFTASDFLTILPLLVLVGWASILLLVDLFIPKDNKGWTAGLAALGLAVTLGLSLTQLGSSGSAFSGMISLDGFATFLNVLVLGSGLVAIALSYDYLKRHDIEKGEYYTLMLFSITGVMLMSLASDLIMVFLALELLSIPLYILVGFARPRPESEESGLKYFLLGAFASGFIVYGIAFVYGATGTTNLIAILEVLKSGAGNINMLIPGAGLVLVGLGFKVGAVPFHMWTPDVYQGAPSSVTAFMAVAAKVGGFAALLRVFVTSFSYRFEVVEELTAVIWALSALTMIVGNVLAVSQKNIKRLLAYSSISHAGFILMAFVPYANGDVAADSVAAALYYLLAFAITSFGVWAIVMKLEQVKDGDDGLHKGLELDDYAGLAHKHKLLAVAMTIFMLSFTGLPPTVGFTGKLFLFRSALEGGYVGLAVIGVLTSLVSAYYYLRIVIIMFMQDGDPTVYKERWLNVTTAVSAVATVALAIFASPLLSWAADSVLKLF